MSSSTGYEPGYACKRFQYSIFQITRGESCLIQRLSNDQRTRIVCGIDHHLTDLFGSLVLIRKQELRNRQEIITPLIKKCAFPTYLVTNCLTKKQAEDR